MLARITTILALLFVLVGSAAAQKLEGDYLYRVTTVRAAPGALANVLEWMTQQKKSGFYDAAGGYAPFVMRHSQGDQWDLMLITPMHSWSEFYSTSAIQKREKAIAVHADLLEIGAELIAFEEDHFAYGPPLSVFKSGYDANNFFHIEMFEAVAGKTQDLLQQRRMENSYLAATEQIPNLIFRRAAGSNVDIFTIGFHPSLESFAAPGQVSDDEKELAAQNAGFKDRADISFYLRALIAAHHDTLAVKVN